MVSLEPQHPDVALFFVERIPIQIIITKMTHIIIVGKRQLLVIYKHL